jgi:hypothetical protein
MKIELNLKEKNYLDGFFDIGRLGLDSHRMRMKDFTVASFQPFRWRELSVKCAHSRPLLGRTSPAEKSAQKRRLFCSQRKFKTIFFNGKEKRNLKK